MKKHPEKYWLGVMVVLLAIFLVALYGKVDIPGGKISGDEVDRVEGARGLVARGGAEF